MSHSIEQLLQHFHDLIIEAGSSDASFSGIDDCTDFDSDSLIFISDSPQLEYLQSASPAVVVTNASLAEQLPNDIQSVVVVSNVRLAQAKIKQYYSDYDASDSEWNEIHASVIIHETAKLANGVRVGPNTVIGSGVSIGANTQVRANCVIEKNAVIGQDCIIHNLVNIGQGCRIGDRVILRPGVIVGNEGFGFAEDEHRHYHRIPHTGIVVIEDDVQVGSNCNIDRATYGETRLKRGVKIDALCHIAHNCVVDEDALFVAQSGIAGSCNIGKRVICSGQTGMLDHKSVADDAILVHRCGVTDDIPSAGMWAGTPAKPFKEYVNNLNAPKRLAKKIAKLEAQIEELSKAQSS